MFTGWFQCKLSGSNDSGPINTEWCQCEVIPGSTVPVVAPVLHWEPGTALCFLSPTLSYITNPLLAGWFDESLNLLQTLLGGPSEDILIQPLLYIQFHGCTILLSPTPCVSQSVTNCFSQILTAYRLYIKFVWFRILSRLCIHSCIRTSLESILHNHFFFK